MTATTVLITLGLASSFASAPAVNPKPWVEVREADEIKVWAREVGNSDIREVKAEAVIDVPSARVWEVLVDVTHYTEFFPYLAEARVVGSAGPRTRYVYQRVDPPIVSSRDYTLRVEGDGDLEKGLYHLKWTAANEQGPAENDDAVRVKVCEGTWTVEPIGENKTHATYYLHTELGGSLPDWVVNIANSRSVPALMAAVRNRSVDPTWRRN